MASLNLTQEELKAAEQTRQRLALLSDSIGSVKASIWDNNPMPSLASLQASADILQHHLRGLLENLSQHNNVFSRVAVHPSTNFPGRTQEDLLTILLRKKPEPDVAAAMDEGRETLSGLVSSAESALPPPPTAAAMGPQGGRAQQQQQANKDPAAAAAALTAEQQRKQMAELEARWAAADDFRIKRIIRYAEEEDNDPFTEEERALGVANVRTGLRRALDDPYAEEDDDDEDEEGQNEGLSSRNNNNGDGDDDLMIVDRPPPPPAPAVAPAPEIEGTSLENIMRITARGDFAPPT